MPGLPQPPSKKSQFKWIISQPREEEIVRSISELAAKEEEDRSSRGNNTNKSSRRRKKIDVQYFLFLQRPEIMYLLCTTGTYIKKEEANVSLHANLCDNQDNNSFPKLDALFLRTCLVCIGTQVNLKSFSFLFLLFVLLRSGNESTNASSVKDHGTARDDDVCLSVLRYRQTSKCVRACSLSR